MRMMVTLMAFLTLCGTTILHGQKADGSSTQRCTLKIEGMVCGACANGVEKAVRKISGVATVKANQPAGTAEVTYDPTKTSAEAIAKVISTKTPFKAAVKK